ncbi:MAG: ABC transporter substrate-binding protein [Methanomicrobiales archaeon]|nr:ABC transporter substrate-binding protein [Methanomicrobiales archaeon]
MERPNPAVIVLVVLILAMAGVVLMELRTVGIEESLNFQEKTLKPATENGILGNHRSVVSTRVITDMAGRQVTIPANVTKVVGSFFIYYLAPEKVGNWESNQTNETRIYYSALPDTLPVVSSSSKNYEAQIALHPDLIFISCGDGNAIRYDSVNLTQEKYGAISVVCLNNTQNVTNAGQVFRFLGNVLDRPERADELIRYYEGTLDEIQEKTSAIPKEKRVRVYYAEGANGLATDASGSIHSQLIDLCGGNNVAGAGGHQSGSGQTAVTMESVLMWKPDVIITTSREFAINVHNDSSWQRIPAVQNDRISVTPNQPGNWFDRSPSFYRIAGMSWTAHVLYPDLFTRDWLKSKIREYFSVYYRYDISDADLDDLLDR